MRISHHLDDVTVLAFAAGTLGEAHSVVAASHIAMCKTCRENVKEAEAVGGLLLSDQDETAVTDRCRAATLASLDGVILRQKSIQSTPPHDVPLPLHRLLNDQPLSTLPWKMRGPGIAKFDLPVSANSKTRLQLLRIGKGRTMPEHGHGGEELTLILRGSYTDHTGTYRAGDVADLDEDMEHQPFVDSDEDCICLVATEAPTRFKSIWARLAQPFVGI